jgi:hypothetical protein
MSKKIRGMDEANLKTPTAKRWAEVASNPDNAGKLVMMLSGDTYVFLGEDATTATKALNFPRNGIFDPMFSFPRSKAALYVAQLRDEGLRVLICNHEEEADATKSFWRARVRVLMGDRRMVDFVKSAGLGIAGLGTFEILTLDYKPGEDVNEERVNASMKRLVEADQADFVISSFKLEELTLVLN